MNKLFVFAPLLLSVLISVPAHAQPALNIQLVDRQSIRVGWPGVASGFVLEQIAAVSSATAWKTINATPVQNNDRFEVTLPISSAAQFFRLRQSAATSIASMSPVDGETSVAVTRETIVHFSGPLAANAVIKTNNFYATAAGRRILSRIELSSDRTKATLFYLEPLPGSARVNVFFDAEGLTDDAGRPLDPAGTGTPNGLKVISFDTLSLTALAGTAAIGTVYASELASGGNQPLAGVTITVDGMEQTLRAVTDANGNFKLSPVPPGRFFVHIDGRTVVDESAGIHYPGKAYYPFVGKAWEAVAGREDNLAGGTGKIYLPLISVGTLQPVSMTSDTTISFPADVVAKNPALVGVNITVPANSLFSDDGTRGGKVGIAPVPPDRLPGPLPPGLEMPLVITVQTDGALNFDKPAPICFPNLPDPVLKTPLPAGSKQALISFDHKRGIWAAVGSMTVSADGKMICSDPGVGIRQPGWHGVAPPPSGPPSCENLCCPNGDEQDDSALLTLSNTAKSPKKKNSPKQCKPEPCKTSRFTCESACFRQEQICDASAWKAYEACLQVARQDECRNGHNAACDHAYARCERIRILLQDPKCQKDHADCKAKCQDCPANGEALQSMTAVNSQDATYDQIQRRLQQISDMLLPFIQSNTPIPEAIYNQSETLRQDANTVAGGDVRQFLTQYVKAQEDALSAAGENLGPDLGNAPAYPVLYAAEIVQGNSRLILRGQTEPFGQYSIFVPRNGELLSISFYDPQTKRIGLVFPSAQSSAPYQLPRFTLRPFDPNALDSDQDGLPDAAELVYGTDPANPDSDGDGIPDGAEVD